MYIRERIPHMHAPNNIYLNETIMLFLKITKNAHEVVGQRTDDASVHFHSILWCEIRSHHRKNLLLHLMGKTKIGLQRNLFSK